MAEERDVRHRFSYMSLAFELGYVIALPAAVFAFGGALLDKRWGTSPLFILVGLALAISSSTLLVARLIKRLSNQ